MRPVLLMTRPEAASRRFIEALRERDADFQPLVSPLFEIVFTGPETGAEIDLNGVAGVIFTSAQGVAAFAARGLPLTIPTCVVGEATARAVAGIAAPPVIVAPTAEALVTAIIAAGLRGPLLHLTGQHRRGDVAERLTAAGIPTRAVTVYDQPDQPLTAAAQAALLGKGPVIAPVFSPRSGKLLALNRCEATLLVAAMSEAVAIAVSPLHIERLKVSSRPDSAAMLDTVVGLLAEARGWMQ